VDTERFTPRAAAARSDFFLYVSQLVPYKRTDLLVDTFNSCGRRLVIIGEGPDLPRLKARARSNIRFWGQQPRQVVVEAMQQCKAFVFAGEEDFGIVIAEAQSCGTPVVAFGKGGAGEIVEPGRTGVLFERQTRAALLEALDRLEQASWDSAAIRQSAQRFGRARFLSEFSALVAREISVSGVPELTSY
jgi:glycosyltransferase involved in cell wall biosynthesis